MDRKLLMKLFGRFRLVLLLPLLLLTAVHICKAQGNNYGIDDTCYLIYRQADSLLGNNGVISLIDKLREQAAKVGDSKAATLAEVLRLRHFTRTKDEEAILSQYQVTKQISLDSKLFQYYFYADHLVSTFYFNRGDRAKGLDYAVKMHDEAMDMDNDYGKWYSSTYLANLHLVDYQRSAAKKALEEAAYTYENTTDETIRVQSMTKTYASLAMLEGFGTDGSIRYLQKASETSKIATDTVLVNFCRACTAAILRQNDKYRHYRDLCYGSPLLNRAYLTATQIFMLTDHALDGDWNYVKSQLGSFDRMVDLIYISDLAAANNDLWTVRNCYDAITRRLVIRFENDLNQAMLETDIMIRNKELNQDLLNEKTRANRLLTFLIILIVAVVTVSAILSALYIRKLKKSKADADKANLMKTYFVQNMSHEIRTPLNAVVGYSQLLAMDEGNLDENERSEYLDYISNNSSLLTMLIDDILDLSDINNGNYRMLKGECNCSEICRMALKTVEGRIPFGVKSSFVCDVPEDLSICSDERRVQQIIINFLTNSCKHTEQGEIELRCSTDVKPGYVTFAVRDTGTGIPEEQADRIFNRFSKLDNIKQGSGLGLNICQVLAEKLGGIVELDRSYGRTASQDGLGARFFLHLSI